LSKRCPAKTFNARNRKARRKARKGEMRRRRMGDDAMRNKTGRRTAKMPTLTVITREWFMVIGMDK
jgi:hypothetical protein